MGSQGQWLMSTAEPLIMPFLAALHLGPVLI
jgi:hypothetical protein